MQFVKAQGRRISHRVPYGSNLAADGEHLPLNTSEHKTVALMRRWRAHGASLRAIADKLNHRDVRTKTGKEWSHVQVDRTLKRAARQADAAKKAG